nr:CTF4=transcription factor [chickens, Peptide Partial, 16 aa] [Gallus gallus]
EATLALSETTNPMGHM